jgi:ribonuclease HI
VSNKHYVVWVGRNPGIYPNWPAAQAQVDKFPRAEYKSFPSFAEAERQFKKGAPSKAQKKAKQKTKAKAVANKFSGEFDPPAVGLGVYCDGACDPNPGEAGAGVAAYLDGTLVYLGYGAYQQEGTNNTAELNGIIKALEYAKKMHKPDMPITIFCDSQYVINSITKWAPGWKKRSWKKADGQPIMNPELMIKAFDLYESAKDLITLKHIPAHSGHIGNELADRMSLIAIAKKTYDFETLPSNMNEEGIQEILKIRGEKH